MARTFVYANRPLDGVIYEDDLVAIDRAGFAVDLNRVIIDSVAPFVASAERPQLCAMLRRAGALDTVVVFELADLGANPRDMLLTIDTCRRNDIALHCIEIGATDLAKRTPPPLVRALRALVRLETASRRERSKTSIAAARDNGRRPGRPPALSERDQKTVLRTLERGVSVSEVARQFSTSRQTILRIRDAAE